ncbi:MAG: hypothetical protein IIV63_05640, partial [Clostridia bacterium]|nr:hypothetical protein [Clostridia bacterium]
SLVSCSEFFIHYDEFLEVFISVATEISLKSIQKHKNSPKFSSLCTKCTLRIVTTYEKGRKCDKIGKK